MEKQIFNNDDFIELGADIGVNIVEATIEKIIQQGMILGMIFKKIIPENFMLSIKAVKMDISLKKLLLI